MQSLISLETRHIKDDIEIGLEIEFIEQTATV
jgi:hypothetical protein